MPVGEAWIIFNVSTSRLEWAESDDVWSPVGELIDGTNQLSSSLFNLSYTGLTYFSMNQSLNELDISAGSAGGTYNAITISDAGILASGNWGVSEIDAAANTALITKEYLEDGASGYRKKDENIEMDSGDDILFDVDNDVSVGSQAESAQSVNTYQLHIKDNTSLDDRDWLIESTNADGDLEINARTVGGGSFASVGTINPDGPTNTSDFTTVGASVANSVSGRT